MRHAYGVSDMSDVRTILQPEPWYLATLGMFADAWGEARYADWRNSWLWLTRGVK